MQTERARGTQFGGDGEGRMVGVGGGGEMDGGARGFSYRTNRICPHIVVNRSVERLMAVSPRRAFGIQQACRDLIEHTTSLSADRM